MRFFSHMELSIILILLTSSIKIFAFADTNATITAELIHDICSKTRNPSICLKNMNSVRGARLFPKPLVALGTIPTISMAKSHGNKTARMIWDKYLGTPARQSELKARYYWCVSYHADAMRQLNKAKKFIMSGEARTVKRYTLLAVDRVDSCDVELIKPPSTKLEANRKFLQANMEFKDLCDIVVEICNRIVEWLI